MRTTKEQYKEKMAAAIELSHISKLALKASLPAVFPRSLVTMADMPFKLKDNESIDEGS